VKHETQKLYKLKKTNLVPADLILFKQRDKSSPVKLAQYNIIPCRATQRSDRIVTINYCDVTSPYVLVV